MRRRIYVDMDGVLCDFRRAACLLHKRQDLADCWPYGAYWFEKLLGCTREEFWEPIEAGGVEFWENLEPYPWALDLFAMCEKFGDTFLLTRAAQFPNSVQGKVRWITKYFGPDFDRMVFTSHKYLLARPEATLIDDLRENCTLFAQHGGRSIWFPLYGSPETANVNYLKFVEHRL